MQPDFPEFKAELSKFLLAQIRQKINQKSAILRGIKRFTQHEGSLHKYEQLPKREVVENQFQMSSAETQTHVEEVPQLIGPKLDAKLDELATQMVAHMEKSLFKTIEDSCDQAGTTVHASLVDVLARRWRRQALASVWFSITRISLMTYVPASGSEFFRWRSSEGALESRFSGEPQTWSQLRDAAEALDFSGLPSSLIKRPDFAIWFILVFPQRFSSELVMLLETALLRQEVSL